MALIYPVAPAGVAGTIEVSRNFAIARGKFASSTGFYCQPRHSEINSKTPLDPDAFSQELFDKNCLKAFASLPATCAQTDVANPASYIYRDANNRANINLPVWINETLANALISAGFRKCTNNHLSWQHTDPNITDIEASQILRPMLHKRSRFKTQTLLAASVRKSHLTSQYQLKMDQLQLL